MENHPCEGEKPYIRPAVVSPRLADLVGDFPAEEWLLPQQEWLVAGVEGLLREAATPFDTAVAVGRFARLASPAPGAAAWNRMQKGFKEPHTACRDWCSLNLQESGTRAWLEAAALAATDSLFEAVDAFFEEAKDEVYLTDLVRFALQRDDLESAAWALGSYEVTQSLYRLDDWVTSRCADTVRDRLGADEHQRRIATVRDETVADHLGTVAWIEPHSWWGHCTS